jgi:hypothetical protein
MMDMGTNMESRVNIVMKIKVIKKDNMVTAMVMVIKTTLL